MKYTLIIGNPIDGFQCCGIFNSIRSAAIFANKNELTSWHIISICPTTEKKRKREKK